MLSRKGVGKLIDISLFLMLSTSLLTMLHYKLSLDEMNLIESRVRQEYVSRMLLSTLKYRVEEWGNLSLAGGIEAYFCFKEIGKDELVKRVKFALNRVKGDLDYILEIRAKDEQIIIYSYKPSICLERVYLSRLLLTTPCGKEINLTLGIFSRYEEVKC